MLEDSEQETFGVTSALFGPDFALQACANPSLLQKGQRVLVRLLESICESCLVVLHASVTRSVTPRASLAGVIAAPKAVSHSCRMASWAT